MYTHALADSNQGQSIQRFGTIWIICSIVAFTLDIFLSFDKHPLRGYLAIADLVEVPSEISTVARNAYESWRGRYNLIRRTAELSALILGTFLTGYGDYMPYWLKQIERRVGV